MKLIYLLFLIFLVGCSTQLTYIQPIKDRCDYHGEIIPIIYFHNIEEKPRFDINIDKKSFDELIDWLKSEDYNTITLQDYYNYTKGGCVPKKPIVLSFDDGFIGVKEYAYPKMKQNNFIGVVALITEIKSESRINYKQARLLQQNGWEIASHSHTHINFLNSSFEKREEEFKISKEILVSNGLDINNFVTPYNFINEEVGKQCSKYYNICTGLGHSEKWVNNITYPNVSWQIPRIVVNSKTNIGLLKERIIAYNK